jgi:hypothetical protein
LKILWYLLRKAAQSVLVLVLIVIILWMFGVLMPVALLGGGVIMFFYSLNPKMWAGMEVPYPLRPLAVLGVTLIALVLLGPARAFAVWTMQFYPPGGADLNFFAVPGIYWIGIEHLPVLDQVWGVATALLYGFAFGRLAMWDQVRVRQIRTLTLSRIAAASQGLVKVVGTVQLLSDSSEYPILNFATDPEKTAWIMNGYQPSFYLKDGTGKMLIVIEGADILPKDAVVESPWADAGSPLTMGAREIHLNKVRRGKQGPQRFGLYRGDVATVIGQVERNPDFGTGKPGSEAENMIRPSAGGFFKPVYYNMFLVADELGDGVRRHLLRRARYNWIIGLLFAGSGLWLMIQGIAAETDFVSVYGILNDRP